MYIYIYIYVCVCVCVCIKQRSYVKGKEKTKKMCVSIHESTYTNTAIQTHTKLQMFSGTFKSNWTITEKKNYRIKQNQKKLSKYFFYKKNHVNLIF